MRGGTAAVRSAGQGKADRETRPTICCGPSSVLPQQDSSPPTAKTLLMLNKLPILLKAIRFEHTAFALPFALISAVVAAAGWPRAWSLAWILVAMVGARTAAMA